MESNVGIRPNADVFALTAGSASAVGEYQVHTRPLFQSTEGDRTMDDVTDLMAVDHVDMNMRALALAEECGSWAVVASYLKGDLF